MIGSAYSDAWHLGSACARRDDWGLWVCPLAEPQNVASIEVRPKQGTRVTMYALHGAALGDNWYPTDAEFDESQITAPSGLGWHHAFAGGNVPDDEVHAIQVPAGSFVVLSLSLPAGVSCSVPEGGWEAVADLDALLAAPGAVYTTDRNTCFVRVPYTDVGVFDAAGLSVPNQAWRGFSETTDFTIVTGCSAANSACSGVPSVVPSFERSVFLTSVIVAAAMPRFERAICAAQLAAAASFWHQSARMPIPLEPTREKLTQILLLTPEEKMYANVLDLLLGLFESEFGYFGYINREGHLVCPSMTRHIFPRCQVADKDIVFRREIWGGLWGRILRERKSLIKNAVHGVPKGHLPIYRSFGSPILYRSELIGQFHFANRPRDYGADDVALLEQICDFVAPVLHARLRHDEEERARRAAEEDLLRANAQLVEKVRELERVNLALIDREERMIAPAAS